MKKRKKNKKIENTSTPVVRNYIDAAGWSPNRAFAPILSVGRRDVTIGGRQRIIGRARSLYYNSPEVRAAVKTLSMLVGELKPLPRTGDEEWNKLAMDAWTRRTSTPAFELTRTLNFGQLQNYIEECAIVDGDCLIVMTTDKTGGGVAVYPAAMVRGGEDGSGVELDAYGRAAYYIVQSQGKETRIPAANCVLYRHSPDPTDPRGLTDLVSAITTAQDVYEINSYHKASVKLGASFGIVETVDANVKRTDVADLKLLRNGGGVHNGTCPADPTTTSGYSPLQINGVNAVTLSPGHDLKTLQDNRPSSEVRNFARDLVDSIAYSVGIDPEILYRVKEMGSASVRFSIAKAKDWARPRLGDKELLCSRIWQHIIACEIAAGRLRPCRDKANSYAVQWIGSSQWSIDRGRDASSAISLVREGLMSRDQYCLENYGRTFEEVAFENVRNLKNVLEVAEAEGVPIALIMPGQPGGQQYGDVQYEGEQSSPNDNNEKK